MEVVAPKPKEQPINHDTKVEKSNDSRNDKKEKILETTGSWEKIDEWQAWGEIGQVQVKHRTPATRAAAIQPPNVTVNVKKVERGKMEPVKKLNATKVPGPKKKNLYSLPSLSFVSNIQDSFTNVAAASTKYSTMVAQLVPGFGALALSAYHDLCHRCCNTRKIDGIYFLVAVRCARLLCSSAIGREFESSCGEESAGSSIEINESSG